MLKKLLVGLSLVGAFSVSAASFEATDTFKNKLKPFLNTDKAVSVEYYKDDVTNLVGIKLLNEQYKRMVFYTTENVDFIMRGAVVDTNSGQNISKEAQEAIDLQPLADELEKLSGIEHNGVDADGDVVYAIIDANCGYCHRAFTNIETLLEKYPNSNLRVKWIMTDIFGQDSIDKAAHVMAKKTSEAQLKALEAVLSRQAINANPQDSIEQERFINANKQFMSQIGGGGVPYIVGKVDGQWLTPNGAAGWFFDALMQSEANKQARNNG